VQGKEQKDKIKRETSVGDQEDTAVAARNAKTMLLDLACSMVWRTRLERTELESLQKTAAYPAAVGDGTGANAGSSVMGSAECARHRYRRRILCLLKLTHSVRPWPMREV
jgi:hypothetical protein